jgi:hypothetical protein
MSTQLASRHRNVNTTRDNIWHDCCCLHGDSLISVCNSQVHHSQAITPCPCTIGINKCCSHLMLPYCMLSYMVMYSKVNKSLVS